MLHGVTTAIEQFGAQDYTVPYRYILLVQFNIKYYRQTTILMGPSALEHFKAYKVLSHITLFERENSSVKWAMNISQVPFHS